MFEKNIKFHKGFTLVELIIVIAIIGIMSAIGFSIWQSSKSDSYLRDAQREVASAVKTAQSYALQGKALGGAGNEFVPCFYTIEFIENTSEYYIGYHSCAGSGIELESFNLNNGIIFSEGEYISFSVPFGAANMAGDGNIKLKHGQDNFKSVSIENGVVIEK